MADSFLKKVSFSKDKEQKGDIVMQKGSTLP